MRILGSSRCRVVNFERPSSGLDRIELDRIELDRIGQATLFLDLLLFDCYRLEISVYRLSIIDYSENSSKAKSKCLHPQGCLLLYFIRLS